MPPKEKSKELKHRNIICLKLTDIELEILNQAASSVGISRSEYLRRLFLNKPIQISYEVVADIKLLRELVGQYGKAHWERYHVGEGRKDIITKWKEPVFVNGDFNDIVANIHVVTNKEADCSLGEGLVKQYLEAKKISFRTEHYIREIRKRYDFSLEWNKTLLFIEFDGEQHFKSINRWGGKKGYLKRRQADIEKNEYCRNKGIPLLRIRFDQAYLIPNMIDDFLKNSEKYSQQFNTYLADDVYYSICQ